MKTMFILSYRAGSTLFLGSMNDQASGRLWPPRKLIGDEQGPLFPPTIPSRICPLMIGQTLSAASCNSIAIRNPEFKHFAWWARVGDNLGRWDAERVAELGKSDWRVYVLMRDPRNQTASFVALEERSPRGSVSLLEFFEKQVHQSKERSQYYLDLEHVGVRLLRFEDLVNDQFNFITSLLEEMGFEPDEELLRMSIPPRDHIPQHSSFKTNLYNDRWRLWTPDQKMFAGDIIGEELIALRYEKDHNWYKG